MADADDCSVRTDPPDQVRELREELEAFVYAVSHDLREPLRSISIYTGFLEREGLTGDALAYTRNLREICTQMERRISDLLTLSQQNQARFSSSSTDVSVIARAAGHRLSELMQENGARLVVHEDLPLANADAPMMQILFEILISNAVIYTAGGENVVEVGFAPQGQMDNPLSDAAFFVRDTGIGIDARYHQRIFKMFERLHPSGVYSDGTGAGLAIARKIVELHGGEIGLTSAADEGSTFYVSLPLAKAHDTCGTRKTASSDNDRGGLH